jgi:alpha-beta hydrolase superfamily lysophospholipase
MTGIEDRLATSFAEGRLAGGRLYYRVAEADAARATVVLAHGYAEHSGRYGYVTDVLTQAGFSVWALDHRGHGQSDGTRGHIGSWDEAVADLDLLIDLAHGAKLPVFLVGHSMGGAMALAYAQAHQDRLAGLGLSAPAIVIPPELLALAELPEVPTLPLADAVSSDPAVVQAYKDDPLVHLGPPPREMLLVMGAVGKIIDDLPTITIPVQVMQGSSDFLIPTQAYRLVVDGVGSTDVTARLWPGLFHEIYNEPVKKQVVGELVRWLTERLG